MPILVLSDTANPNHRLAAMLAADVQSRQGRVAYVSPSRQSHPRSWFLTTVNEYKRLDPTIKVEYFDLSRDFSKQQLASLRDFGTIHLSGGNAFEFVSMARERGFEDVLHRHLYAGGLIVGVSAGGIILTPTVMTASLAGDENTVNIGDKSGLNLLPFEFVPHFHMSTEQLHKVVAYSRTTPNVIYACSDSDGIRAENGSITEYGGSFRIANGRICQSLQNDDDLCAVRSHRSGG